MDLPSDTQRFSVIPTPQETGEVVVLRDKSPTIHLKTLHDVRIEMAKVYRAAKTREIDSQEGSRLIYMLSSLGKIVEAEQVSDRLDAIDRVLKRRS